MQRKINVIHQPDGNNEIENGYRQPYYPTQNNYDNRQRTMNNIRPLVNPTQNYERQNQYNKYPMMHQQTNQYTYINRQNRYENHNNNNYDSSALEIKQESLDKLKQEFNAVMNNSIKSSQSYSEEKTSGKRKNDESDQQINNEDHAQNKLNDEKNENNEVSTEDNKELANKKTNKKKHYRQELRDHIEEEKSIHQTTASRDPSQKQERIFS